MALLFYNLFLLLYKTGVWLVSPWNPKAKRWIAGRRNILENIRQTIGTDNASGMVWMHCASLGEFEQGRPVLEQVRAANPGTRIVLTFFSPSGYEIRKNYSGADYIFYLPTDSESNARAFIRLIRPKLVIWVKYEYWYYYLTLLKKEQVPLILISGIFRENQVFFRWYGALHRKMLACFSHLFVQNKKSQSLLAALNFMNNVSVSGDTRFDRVIDIAEKATPIPVIAGFCDGYKVIVAGSTWKEDEEVLKHFASVQPEIRLIIAPHEIGAQHLQDLQRLFPGSILFTDWEKRLSKETTFSPGPVPNVLIINNIGMLSSLYQYATIAYIGGGFNSTGIHNVLEAAVYGKPVIFGPVYNKFAEAIELVQNGGSFTISNAKELESRIEVLLTNNKDCIRAGEAAKKYVYSKRGATERIMYYIKNRRLL